MSTEHTEPEGPTDEEIDAWADDNGFVQGHADHPCAFWIKDEDLGEIVRAALARWGKSTTQSKELNRQEMKTFACEWWNKFGFAKDKATCTWVIDEIDPDHFVDFIFDFLAKCGHDTRLTEES